MIINNKEYYYKMIQALLGDKTLKPKERTEQLAKLVSNGTVAVSDLRQFAEGAKATITATCIECLEFATQSAPGIISADDMEWIIEQLKAKEPRIKWESAKVIGNTIATYPNKAEKALNILLENAAHEGTVVRWSAAFAIGEILKLNGKINKTLIPAVENIITNEEKNSIKKIYLAALKKSK